MNSTIRMGGLADARPYTGLAQRWHACRYRAPRAQPLRVRSPTSMCIPGGEELKHVFRSQQSGGVSASNQEYWANIELLPTCFLGVWTYGRKHGGCFCVRFYSSGGTAISYSQWKQRRETPGDYQEFTVSNTVYMLLKLPAVLLGQPGVSFCTGN